MARSKYLATLLMLMFLVFNAIAQNKQADLSGKKSWAPPNYDSLYKGKPYPAFDLTTLDGKRLTNESCKGKVTFISFWFEGCGGCRDEFPQMNELYDSLKIDSRCQFVAVTFDEPAGIPAFIAKYGLHFPIGATSHEEFKRLNYGMASPGIVILDKNTDIAFMGIKALTKQDTPGKYTLSIAKAISIIKDLE